MFNKFLNNFRALPESNRSLVFLLWIYYIWNVVANIFINIYIYKLNDSFNDLIVYYIFYFTFTFFGFAFVGYLMSVLQKSIKYLYYYSYLFFVISFILLFVLWESYLWIILFGILYWLWHWMYWNWMHSQELANIKNKKREMYASAVSIWKSLSEIIVPLMVSVIFIFSDNINVNWYFILFFTLPFIYFLSFFFINNIDDYIPNKIKYKNVKKHINFKKHKNWNMFFMFWWMQMVVSAVIMWVLSLYMLKNEVNIWFFQWLLALFSTALVIYLSFNRNEKNRFKYLVIFSLLYFFNYLIFVVNFNFIWFVIFSLLNIFIHPLYRVSYHVYHLSLVDNMKNEDGDFYLWMLIREIYLFVWRLFILIMMYFIINYFSLNNMYILKWWILFVWLMFFILTLNIYLWEKYEEKK